MLTILSGMAAIPKTRGNLGLLSKLREKLNFSREFLEINQFLTNIFDDKAGLLLAVILSVMLIWIIYESKDKHMPLIK